MQLASRARAKVNLTLHVPRRRDDGWHEIESLVAFAGFGDHLAFAPGPALSLTVSGPAAPAIGAAADNLVLRGARHLAEGVEGMRLGRFHLVKRLPVASGVGGGSADAAAALRLLAAVNGLKLRDPRLIEAAARTGADVPVCVDSTARIMAGKGERLGPMLDLPRLFAVLVNPGRALETRAVFARMGLERGEVRNLGDHPPITDGMDREDFIAALARARNDMEAAACDLLPIIREQLAALSASPGCRLARMSGSGATCFGLFDDRRAAVAAAGLIRQNRPEWWVTATTLR